MDNWDWGVVSGTLGTARDFPNCPCCTTVRLTIACGQSYIWYSMGFAQTVHVVPQYKWHGIDSWDWGILSGIAQDFLKLSIPMVWMVLDGQLGLGISEKYSVGYSQTVHTVPWSKCYEMDSWELSVVNGAFTTVWDISKLSTLYHGINGMV